MTGYDEHIDFDKLVSDLPIDITVDPSGDTVRITHFVSKNQKQGYATKALNRIIETAKNNNYDKIILHIGKGREEDDVEGFVEERMGFTIYKSKDKINAYYSLD